MRGKELGSQNKDYTDEQALRLAEKVRSLSTGFHVHKPRRFQKPAVKAAWNNLKVTADAYREANKLLPGGGDQVAQTQALKTAKTELQRAFIRFITHSQGRRFEAFEKAGFLNIDKVQGIKLERKKGLLASLKKALRRARPVDTVRRPVESGSSRSSQSRGRGGGGA